MIYIYLTLISAAFIFVECLAGGTRLLYSLPAYSLLGVASVLTLFSVRTARSPRPACLLSSALFFGYILWRCYTSPVEYLARADFFMVLGSLAIYLITAFYLVKAPHRMILVAVLLALAVGQVAVGLVQFSRHNDFNLFGYQRYPNEGRASGQYVSPNHFAGYLEVVAVMGISLVCWGMWKPWAKILAAYVSLVSLVGILMSGSRGGYVSAVFCILAFFALSIAVVKIAFPERLLRVSGVIVGVLLIAVLAVPLAGMSPLIRTRAEKIFSKDMRLELWRGAVEEIKLDPVLGGGSGSYLYYGRKFRAPDVQLDPVRVHNDYLDLVTEYGFVGAAGFLIFFVCHLVNGFHTFRWLATKRLQYSSDWRSSSLALNIGCLCAVAAYVSHSAVDFNLHIPANAMLMAFVFGVLANPGLETFQETKITSGTKWLFQAALPLLGVAILALGMPKIPGEYYAEQARVALRDGKFFEAAALAKQALQWEKRNADIYYYLGEARRRAGDAFPPSPIKTSFYKAASESFTQGLELFPQDVRLLLLEAWTQDALGNFGQAEHYFGLARSWDPNSDEVKESYREHIDYFFTSLQKPVPKQ